MNESILTDDARNLYDTVGAAVADWEYPRTGGDVSAAPTFTGHWGVAVELGWTSILDSRPAAGTDEFVGLLDAAGAAVNGLARAGVTLPVRQALVAHYAATEALDDEAIATYEGMPGVWDPIAAFSVDAAGHVTARNPAGTHAIDLAGRPITLAEPSAAPAADVSRVATYLLTQEIAGAVDGAVEHTRRYCGERIQFGRPLDRIPAVRSTLGELTVAQNEIHSALGEAITRLTEPDDTHARIDFALATCLEIGARAADETATTAHQLHGAMGITEDSTLHHRTTLLWAALDEIAAHPSTPHMHATTTEDGLWSLTTPSIG
ncbi:acyl-CoA dehydrogenase family protein [Tomitella gaofuii]|uniref:acyl-CoA dehydrogenase family protein n=1 Tax=Tomitella gaofuii TaxID=2760083 RepID=UPI0015FE40AB|nr:acyl-CoA dehydrogenase family protein [Tomitella gaofuii]